MWQYVKLFRQFIVRSLAREKLRTSQVIGLVIGVLLSVVLIYVINVQSFGWTIQFHIPVRFLLQSTVLILLATAIAGLYPASRATGIDAVRFVREE